MFIYITWDTIYGCISISKMKPLTSNINIVNFDENIAAYAKYNDEGVAVINVPNNINELYFFFTTLELGGRYSKEVYLYCYKTYLDAEERALDFLDDEHNRNDDCDECEETGSNEDCANYMLKQLKDRGYASFNPSDYEETTIYIKKFTI